MHVLEKTILTIAGVSCFISLWFIPRKHCAKAIFIFLLTQFFSWILGLVVVEFGYLDYPVREFAKANSTSFLFEFFILPVITIFFILNYPKDKPLKTRALYAVSFVSIFTFAESILEKYTLIIHYYSWQWYCTWISMALLFYVVMTIYKWYFRLT